MSTIASTNEITHDIELGQVYEDSRTGESIQLIYLDRNIYVLQNETNASHRIGKRDELDRNVASDRYSFCPEAEPFATTGLLERVRALREKYSDQDGYTAEHKVEALTEALEILTDLRSPDDAEPIPFEELDSIGEKAAENLRKAGYETCDDVFRADDSDLTAVSWVGDAGVESIREYCK